MAETTHVLSEAEQREKVNFDLQVSSLLSLFLSLHYKCGVRYDKSSFVEKQQCSD